MLYGIFAGEVTALLTPPMVTDHSMDAKNSNTGNDSLTSATDTEAVAVFYRNNPGQSPAGRTAKLTGALPVAPLCGAAVQNAGFGVAGTWLFNGISGQENTKKPLVTGATIGVLLPVGGVVTKHTGSTTLGRDYDFWVGVGATEQ